MNYSRWISLLALLVVPGLAGADWPEFRGAGGAASSGDAGVPAQWDESTNLLWKAKLPGQGASSPIIVGNRVVVTCFTGEPGRLVRHLVCVNRKVGDIAWTKEIKSSTREANYNGMMTQH